MMCSPFTILQLLEVALAWPCHAKNARATIGAPRHIYLRSYFLTLSVADCVHKVDSLEVLVRDRWAVAAWGYRNGLCHPVKWQRDAGATRREETPKTCKLAC